MSDTDPTRETTPFDRRVRRMKRDRAAAATEAHPLLRVLADDLLDRLESVKRPFTSALDLGCGPGLLTRELRARGLEVVSADAGQRFADRCDGIQCDEDRLPFAPGTFDLIVSAGTLDSVNDLPGALVQVRRALKPDGLFLGAMLGAGSLPQLRAAMRAADDAEDRSASPHIHPQIDLRAAGDLLGRAGFALPVVDAERTILRYSSLDKLLTDLRNLGWGNMLSARSHRPIGRLGYAAAHAAFAAQADRDGRVSERIEIIHLSGWAPAPTQPQPARRGSGSVSLEQALRRKN